jgi:hypothetical protein
MSNGVLLVILAASWLAPSVASAGADPLGDPYVVPSERQRGTAYGQIDLWSGVGGRSQDGRSGEWQSTIELMTFAWIGVRTSSAVTLDRGSAPTRRWLIASVGPSVHLFPYRRFDVALYVEGGVVRVRDREAHYAPALTPGVSVEWWWRARGRRGSPRGS